MQQSQLKSRINWVNSIVLFLTPLLALSIVPIYGYYVGYDLFEWAMFGIFMMATGIGITAGYHRLWSHKTYQASAWYRLIMAVFGAAALQNSILCWSADHRRHHRFTDHDTKDPYSASRGFWYSHIGWILVKGEEFEPKFCNVKDLQRDPIVMWQHRYYIPLAIFVNLAVPLAIGFFHGKLWGTLLLASLLRIVLNHQFTFFINSLAHIWGRQPYSDENSARDNDLLALVTYGEGYHNFHHRFQSDYRNGVRWWQYDPSKWMIKALSWVGVTKGLKYASRYKIEKARMKMQYQRALLNLEQNHQKEDWRARLEESYQQCSMALDDWARFRQEWVAAKRQQLRERLDRVALREKYIELKYNLKLQRHRWRLLASQFA